MEIVGDDVEKLVKEDFRVDRDEIVRKDSKLLKFSRNLLKKPYIIEEKCIKCGICVKSCPLQDKALDFADGEDKPPVYDYDKCIRCFCCQEMCPEQAIDVKTPFLGRMVFYRR